MRIINPIYDTAFKFLFQDLDAAKLLIEAILDVKIISIKHLGHEYFSPKKASEKHRIKTYKLDFVCQIQTKDGASRILLIEIQRKNRPQDIGRFRKYLSFHYGSEQHIDKGVPIEICTMYFLEKAETVFNQYPVVKVRRQYIDLTTNLEIPGIKSKFVEKLTHELYHINISALNFQLNHQLVSVLQIFNQKNMGSDKVILEIDEKGYPKPFTLLLERLKVENIQEPLLMLLEEEAKKENELDSMGLRLVKSQKATLAAQQKAQVAEQKAQKEEKAKVAAQQKAQKEEKEKLAAQQKAILVLQELQIPIEVIAQKLELSIEKVKEFIREK